MAETKRYTPSAELGDTFILVFRESKMALFFTHFCLGLCETILISCSYNNRHEALAQLDTLSPMSPLG